MDPESFGCPGAGCHVGLRRSGASGAASSQRNRRLPETGGVFPSRWKSWLSSRPSPEQSEEEGDSSGSEANNADEGSDGLVLKGGRAIKLRWRGRIGDRVK